MLVIHADIIRKAISPQDLFEPLRKAFACFSKQESGCTAISMMHFPDGGDVHIKSSFLPGYPFYTVKMVSSIPSSTGNINNGMIAVFDVSNGKPYCLLEDEGYLTDIRTAAAGALVTHELANIEATKLGVIGTGIQAKLQTEVLMKLRALKQIVIWGRDRNKAIELKEQLQNNYPDISIRTCDSVCQLLNESEMIIAATSSLEPLIQKEWLKPGHHLTALGADDLYKRELEPDVFGESVKIFVDSVEANQHFGELSIALKQGIVTKNQITEIGNVFSNKNDDRTNAQEITIAKLVGLGIQDLVAATTLLKKLK